MADLEIRGAGNLLGDEQSGHVAAVGFEMYAQMLEEAVRELQGEHAAARGAGARRPAGDRLRAAGLHRLRGQQDRRAPAHRAGRTSLRELGDVRAELADRFGPPPEPVENLLTLQAIKLKAAELGAALAVTYRGGRLQVDGLDLDDASGGARARRRRARRLLQAGRIAERSSGRPRLPICSGGSRLCSMLYSTPVCLATSPLSLGESSL